MREPKILFWDIETTPIISYTWNLYPTAISTDSVIRDWTIICGAWKFLGEDEVHSVAIKDVDNDYDVVMTLANALRSADVIVHHNGDSFDIKKLVMRMIYHGLPPLPEIDTVDTKKAVKRVAAFTSNKMDYLCKMLTGKGKIHVDYELWLRIMKNDKEALAEMVKYNEVDVIRNEELYLKLLPYMKTHPHVGALSGKDRKCSCPRCGSTNVKKNGIRLTKTGLIRQEMQCTDCGSYHRIATTK
jgi:uncharacterized protein YprB with RNaseH-like and TPR domain